jgi:transposase
MLRDEHGRLLFSARLKQRDQRHLQAILRWLRMLGLHIQTVYVDFWSAYPPAIRAIFPDAQIQYDFFHVIQNIHRHLYKALTTYRKAFKSASREPAQRQAREALHKKLWKHRYLLFTNAENLSDEQHRLLQELLNEHADTLVEHIVIFRHCLRDVFNESESFQQAVDHLALLRVEGWSELAEAFRKVLTFLQDHLDQIFTYLRVPGVQRHSLAECTIRGLRRLEWGRQGFKTQHGRVEHLKLLLWRRYLCPVKP